jgi:chromosome segregation and condensation protein ScpB
LYETTRKFLELFGLHSLSQLPHAGELRKRRETDGVEEADAA